jgi:hypothetical protein
MAKIDWVSTHLEVKVDVVCDCGETVSLDGICEDETCECGIEYSTRIDHDGSRYRVVVKQNGEEIHNTDVCF